MRLTCFYKRSPQWKLRIKTKCLVPESHELDDENVIASDRRSCVRLLSYND